MRVRNEGLGEALSRLGTHGAIVRVGDRSLVAPATRERFDGSTTSPSSITSSPTPRCASWRNERPDAVEANDAGADAAKLALDHLARTKCSVSIVGAGKTSIKVTGERVHDGPCRRSPGIAGL